MIAPDQSKILSSFLQSGYVHIKNAIPVEFIDEWTLPALDLLSNPNNLAVLKPFGSHLYFPRTKSFDAKHRLPLLWDIVCTLAGGKDNVLTQNWGNGFVAAVPGQAETEIKERWHKDGFHRHFLDSPEIGLIVILLWTDVHYNSGATEVAEDSIKIVANELYNHPEGLDPDYFETLLPESTNVSKLVGSRGDAFIMHPFLLHARRKNSSLFWRLITNVHIEMREHLFNTSHAPIRNHIERVIVDALGKDCNDYCISGKRGLCNSVVRNQLGDSRDVIKSLLSKS